MQDRSDCGEFEMQTHVFIPTMLQQMRQVITMPENSIDDTAV